MNPNQNSNNNSNKEIATTSTTDFMKDSMTMDFTQLFNQDDKEVSKAIKYEQNKKGKQVQLLAKINSIQMQISTAQTDYVRSLVNPNKDSVGLAIDIRSLNEQLKIAETVYAQLFPELVSKSQNAAMPATEQK